MRKDRLQKHSTKNPNSARKMPPFCKFPAGAGRGEGQGARGDKSALNEVSESVEVWARSGGRELVEKKCLAARKSGAWSLQPVESPGIAEVTRAGGAAKPVVPQSCAVVCGTWRGSQRDCGAKARSLSDRA